MRLNYAKKKTIKEICAITGVSQASLYRKLRELNGTDS
ncbi:helix-turn-helix domain-containing protein [Bacillus thuringiensis]|nr:helix-turn-helix domain-containing protein [Bacillus thuringiensis]